MFTHTHVKAKTVTYSLDDIIKYTTKLVRPTSNRMSPILNKVEHYQPCMKFISKFVQSHCWEMLGTHEGFKIITNGYKEFKEIVMTDSGQVFKADQIFDRMRLISVNS